MSTVTIDELSTATLEGSGVFDVLMRSVKSHLDKEFLQGRLKGPEYATVYLGSLDQCLQTGLSFVLQRQKTDLEAQLLAKQIELAGVEKDKALVELEILTLNKNGKLPAEIAQLVSQTSLTDQQKLNLQSEKLGIESRTHLTDQQKTNLISENLGTLAKTENLGVEKTVLVAQECKLRAEYDLTQKTTLKTDQEINLLTQKTATERAQVTAMGVDADSVIGRQKNLYVAQTDGFKRDAEQKAAKLLADTWSVRRTTDEGTSANTTNKLDDSTVGRVIAKLLTGVDA